MFCWTNSHPKTDIFKFTNVSRYIKVYYLNMNKKNRIYHSYVYSQIHARKLSFWRCHFSLFDFWGQKGKLKCI